MPVNQAKFPPNYKDIEAVWLFHKIEDGSTCLICGKPATYTVVDEEGVAFNRCQDCFNKLLELKRILMVEEGYWIHILSKEFNGLRKNPHPPKLKPIGKPQIENSLFKKCEYCGCHFATQSDLENHVKAWHTPGGIYHGER